MRSLSVMCSLSSATLALFLYTPPPLIILQNFSHAQLLVDVAARACGVHFLMSSIPWRALGGCTQCNGTQSR
jgi:hypothetical protein